MKKLGIIMLLAFTFNAYSQQNNLHFDHLTIADGLPEAQVQSIVQDKLGYIWFTTQDGLVKYDGYQVKVYKLGIENKTNFPDYIVTDVFLDKQGQLWANTASNGLFRYDISRDRFTQFKNRQVSQEGYRLNARIDSAGKIWYLIYKKNILSVEKFDPATRNFTRYDKPEKGLRALTYTEFNIFYVSATGTVWVGTNNGCYRYDPKTDTFKGLLNTGAEALQNNVTQIYQAPSNPGLLYMAVERNKDKHSYLYVFNLSNGKIAQYNHLVSDPYSLGSDTVYAIHEDKKHQIWISTKSGLSLFTPETKRFNNFIPTDSISRKEHNQIGDIAEDAEGKLWMITQKGLLAFDPASHSFTRFVHDKNDPTSLAVNDINTMMFDRTGTLWLGLDFKGVDRVNTPKSAFTLLSKDWPAPITDEYYGVANSSDGNLLVGTKSGLYKYTNRTGNLTLVKKTDPGLSFEFKMPYQANDGSVYYRCASGLGIYDPLTGKTERYSYAANDSTSLSNNTIEVVKQDHTGKIWVGTWGGGICLFNPVTKKFKRYPYFINDNKTTSKGELDDNQVYTIYEDRHGTVWAGTNNGGLNHYDRKKDIFVSSFQPYDGTASLSSIIEDQDGNLWIGVYLNGIFQVDHNTGTIIKHISVKEGLLSDNIIDLRASGDYLWVLNARGLSRVNIKDFSIRNFNASDSYWTDQTINNGRYHSSLMDKNGDLSLVGNGHVIAVNTRLLFNDPQPPVVHLETIMHDDPTAAKVDVTTEQTYGRQSIELPYNQNRITYRYVGLQYNNPAGIKYAYQLDGYDKNWVQAGNQRTVTYNNLAPATYTFHVKAANSDGVWSKEVASFIVLIHPPWWATWWARSIFIIIFIIIIWAIIHYRSRSLLRAKRLLEQKVQLRTQEVLEQKEEIAAQRDGLENTLEELKSTQTQLVQREKMASLGELTAGIAHEIQNPLNFVNNFSEVSAELVGELDEELDKGDIDEAKAIAWSVKQNLEKIRHHGKRADSIVKGMLQHSRTNTTEKEAVNINVVAYEYFRLAYHGLRAADKGFNSEMVTHFDDQLPAISAVPQDIGRVLLNLFNNAFYAVNQKQKTTTSAYKPEVSVTTYRDNGSVIIKVKDNGNGIPENIRQKIMQPFFTTKPTGEGTGLGLSLTYDIVVKSHSGSIDLTTKEGEFTEFVVKLPVS